MKRYIYIYDLRMFSTADFIRFGCRDNPFIRYPGFHVSMVCGDWLHVMDLAVVPDACGSVLGPYVFN